MSKTFNKAGLGVAWDAVYCGHVCQVNINTNPVYLRGKKLLPR